jgi:hypothetical protein
MVAVLFAAEVTDVSTVSPDEEESNCEELLPYICFSSANAMEGHFEVGVIFDEDVSSIATPSTSCAVSNLSSDAVSYALI